jgi:hypothetical protein
MGGGPAHGYCSLDCTADPQLCLAFDAHAHCMTSSQMTTSYCLKGCVLGDTAGEAKCADRPDLSCSLIGLTPVCMPNCGGDADCPASRHCDHRDGVCVDGPRLGEIPGFDCDPELPVSETTCDAYCAAFPNGAGVCSGLCTLGAPYACNVPADTNDVVGLPLCITFTGDGPGDTGVCVQRCRCNEDCDHPQAYCDLDRPEVHDGIGLCLFDFDAEPGTLGVACGVLSDASVDEASVDADASQ